MKTVVSATGKHHLTHPNGFTYCGLRPAQVRPVGPSSWTFFRQSDHCASCEWAAAKLFDRDRRRAKP